ncbi:MAG TPA: formate dehydrogenase accessory sulfurtransferase FdhD [Streptosporangiaceae bacterium]
MTGRTARRRILRVTAAGPSGAGGLEGGEGTHRADLLATEEPLEIRVNGRPLAVTMRTPGDDIDLAAGFLVTEGLVQDSSGIAGIRICEAGQDLAAGAGARQNGDGGARSPGNVADVTLAAGVDIDDDRLRRNFLTTSACGVCGKASIDAIRVRAVHDVAADPVSVAASVLAGLPGTLRAAQRVFAHTGGLHAAGVFTADGSMLTLREDVGRHNAVDKVAGWAAREGRLPLAGHILLVSGRASFELVQKAYVTGIPVVAAVSAPSSLAADLAGEAGMTLVGFLRGNSMNVYTGDHRIASP